MPLARGASVIPTAVDQLQGAIAEAAGRYYHLVLVVGPAGSGKTRLLRQAELEFGYSSLNLSLELSRRLLDLTASSRSLRAPRLLAEVLSAEVSDVLLVDNSELLFEPTLQLDQLAALQQCARDRTLVVTWGGRWDGSVLTYAEPGHPEYVRYENPDAVVCAL